ncbi:hypothetical protein ACFOG5_07525 [Pedobacter fastidiosus]|nr:hypothetical protein [Pedobacter fastidiosus]
MSKLLFLSLIETAATNFSIGATVQSRAVICHKVMTLRFQKKIGLIIY